MYTYYLIAGLGPEYQKYLWWKKYVTELQLVQFVIILIHNLQVLPRDCNYPKGIVILLTINASLFIYLFGSFFVKTYRKNKASEKLQKAQPETEIVKEEHKVGNGKIAESIQREVSENGKMKNQ